MMSIAGVLSSSLFGSSTQNTQQTTAQKLKQEFQQLGQDLQSGNLSAAQADLSTLQQNAPQNSAIAGGQSGSPISQAFKQLSTDLQAGNLSAAQTDYSTIRQDFKNQATQGGGHHHHPGAGGTNPATATGSSTNPVTQLLAQLGTALQAGNLSAAQTAYTTLQQDFQQFAQNGGLSGSSSAAGQTGVSGVSVTA
ncbi:MAG: hypothetical protein ABSG16_00650 [Candidatus Acidiferrum sp.]|jgi:outer membrane protein assembly factor BamD (BamD/ComL family)